MKLSILALGLVSAFVNHQAEAVGLSRYDLSDDFDFDEFGKCHNDYLDYVRNAGLRSPEERYKYGMSTFKSPIFGPYKDLRSATYEQCSTCFLNAGYHHTDRVENILAGKYDAAKEMNARRQRLSDDMTVFLNKLAKGIKAANDNDESLESFVGRTIPQLEKEVRSSQKIEIDLKTGKSNDGAAMLAILSILKYSIRYWSSQNISSRDDGNLRGRELVGWWKKVKRALADAWGYVSDWQPNGDGSYTWSHGSAVVNADCVSDTVYEDGP